MGLNSLNYRDDLTYSIEDIVEQTLKDEKPNVFLNFMSKEIAKVEEGEFLSIDIKEIHILLTSYSEILTFFINNKYLFNFCIDGLVMDCRYSDKYFSYVGNLLDSYKELDGNVPCDFLGVRILLRVIYSFFKLNSDLVLLDEDYFLLFLKNMATALEGIDLDNENIEVLEDVFDKCIEISKFFAGKYDFENVEIRLVKIEQEYLVKDPGSTFSYLKERKAKSGMNSYLKQKGLSILNDNFEKIKEANNQGLSYKGCLNKVLEILVFLEIDPNDSIYKSLLIGLLNDCFEYAKNTKSNEVFESYSLLLAVITSLYSRSSEAEIVGFFDMAIKLGVIVTDVSFEELDNEVVDYFNLNLSAFSPLRFTRLKVAQILAGWGYN